MSEYIARRAIPIHRYTYGLKLNIFIVTNVNIISHFLNQVYSPEKDGCTLPNGLNRRINQDRQQTTDSSPCYEMRTENHQGRSDQGGGGSLHPVQTWTINSASPTNHQHAFGYDPYAVSAYAPAVTMRLCNY